MKKLIVAAALAISTSTHAGLLTNVLSDATRDKQPNEKPTAEYNLDTYGNDVRVYEWTPKDNKNIRCVFVAGSKNSTGVACYPAEKN